jgi:hypothetical protein
LRGGQGGAAASSVFIAAAVIQLAAIGCLLAGRQGSETS